MRLYIFI